MLLLAEEPSHGYLLVGKLTEMGFVESGTDPSMVYRVLRMLEEEGLAFSEHVDEGRGPARKVYRLTEEGHNALAVWAQHMGNVGSLIDEFQERYGSLDRG